MELNRRQEIRQFSGPIRLHPNSQTATMRREHDEVSTVEHELDETVTFREHANELVG